MLQWVREGLYSIRQLLRSPAFASASILTLAMAIGTAATVFALLESLLDRPARILDRQGVHWIALVTRIPAYSELSYDVVAAIRADLPPSALAMLAVTSDRVIVQRDGAAEMTSAQFIDGDYQTVFRISPATGRLLQPVDDAAGIRTAVISYRLWRSWFQGKDSRLGVTTIRVNNEPFTVVGVMPRGFSGMREPTDLWLPAAARASVVQRATRRPEPLWSVYIRERPEFGPQRLQTEVAALLSRISTRLDGHFRLYPAEHSRNFLGFRLSTLRPQLFAIAGLLLLAACANLSNMLYARVRQRAGEIAVRQSLGAGSGSIVRLFLVEVVVITTASGVIGYGLAAIAITQLVDALPLFSDAAAGIEPDVAPGLLTAVFVAGLGVCLCLLLAAMIWLTLARVSTLRQLTSAAGAAVTPVSTRRFRLTLVSVQVTVAVGLLLGCGLLIISARERLTQEIDFSRFRYPVAELASARFDLAYHGYNEVRGRSFQRELLDAAKQLPGVSSAALATGIPGGRAGRGDAATMQFIAAEVHGERSGQERRLDGAYAAVSESFPSVAGLQITDGRTFGAADGDGAPLVAIVTENVASVLWPRDDAIGRRIVFSADGRPREVVGIIANPVDSSSAPRLARRNALVLVPIEQAFRPDAMILLRSTAPHGAAEAAVVAIRSIDAAVAVFDAAPVLDTILAWTKPVRVAETAVSVLGGLALLFAGLGIYGVMTFFVSTRLREFGIRLALGATPRQVNRLVVDEAVHLLLVGLFCGVFLAAVSERVLQHNIVRLMTNAVGTWVVTVLLILVAGLVASFLPARRAGMVDPNIALRDL